MQQYHPKPSSVITITAAFVHTEQHLHVQIKTPKEQSLNLSVLMSRAVSLISSAFNLHKPFGACASQV